MFARNDDYGIFKFLLKLSPVTFNEVLGSGTLATSYDIIDRYRKPGLKFSLDFCIGYPEDYIERMDEHNMPIISKTKPTTPDGDSQEQEHINAERDFYAEHIAKAVRYARHKVHPHVSFVNCRLSNLVGHSFLKDLSSFIVNHPQNIPNSIAVDGYKQLRIPSETNEVDGAVSESPLLSPFHVTELERLMKRLQPIIEDARSHEIPIVLEAEQSWIQPAIDQIYMKMSEILNDMHRHQNGYSLLYNTYQMYLRDSKYRLEHDTEYAKYRGYRHGVQLVKGGYLEDESHSSLSGSLKGTTENFLKATQFAWGENHVDMILSSHDHKLIGELVQWMENANMKVGDPRVIFSQYYGFGDHVSYGLLNEDYLVVRKLSYGPMSRKLEQIGRILRQNGFSYPDGKAERGLLRKEFSRRILEDGYIV